MPKDLPTLKESVECSFFQTWNNQKKKFWLLVCSIKSDMIFLLTEVFKIFIGWLKLTDESKKIKLPFR